MSNILIFAGTTEGRNLSKILAESKINHTVCVATEYGSKLIDENEYTCIHCGRMNRDEMKDFMDKGNYDTVIDATHPYAYEVTANIKNAALEADIRYIRLKRNMGKIEDDKMIRFFNTNEECVDALEKTEGNILLTTGSKELSVYASRDSLKDRLIARVIPSEESVKICSSLGINGKNIIAMQGPFSLEMNEAITDMYQIGVIVTKNSGIPGGFLEKAECAKNKNIPLFVIGCADNEEGISLEETLEQIGLNDINSKTGLSGEKTQKPSCEKSQELSVEKGFNQSIISLIGIGPGNKDVLTEEAGNAIEEADILIGARRLLDTFSTLNVEKYPFYESKDIIPLIEENETANQYKKYAILFSGDTSFYSGASGLIKALEKEQNDGGLKAEIRMLPGISSLSYFASKIGVDYSDAKIISIHGRTIFNLGQIIKHEKKTFILVSGVKDINSIGDKIIAEGLRNSRVTLGYRLSYEDEEIINLTPDECSGFDKDGLFICFVSNPEAESENATHGLPDSYFVRDKVPMTKEEVREVSLSKLRLKKDSILWDIGSGTGSVSVEAALLSNDIKVFAIEKKDEASDLTAKNIINANLENVTIIRGSAPEALENLTPATHAFIGGSSGNLKEILESLKNSNDKMRVVINAISIETMAEFKKIPEEFEVDDFEIIQMQVSRSDEVGNYHLMKAENPIWICSFNFK